jgi:hypothetical protein
MNIIGILLFTIFGFTQHTGEAIYVIPKDYHGTVLILFDQKNGAAPKYKNGKRLYEIPPDGVLKTQLAPNSGIGTLQFKVNTKDFNESELKYMTSSDWRKYPVDSEEIVCWNLEVGVTETHKKEKIKFEVFSIGSIKQSEVISDERVAFISKALSVY